MNNERVLKRASLEKVWNKIKTVFFNKSVTDISISGRTVTITKGDGSTSTQTTQDTNTTYSDATQSAHGLMSATDKKKLDGVAENANNYTHPTSSGNKHIPAGGSSGKILRWSADGTAVWGDDKDTTYSTFKGATTDKPGGAGLVPAPDSGETDYLMTGEGEWKKPGVSVTPKASGVTLAFKMGDTDVATAAIGSAGANTYGLMSPGMYSKLDDLPTGSAIENTYAKKEDITGMYKFKASVADASKLPTSGQKSGDVYSIETDSDFGPAGTNVAWTSDGKWDNLGGIFVIEELTQEDIDEICV